VTNPRLLLEADGGVVIATELVYATPRSIERSHSYTLDGTARKMTAAP
jgi:hypothetical protein